MPGQEMPALHAKVGTLAQERILPFAVILLLILSAVALPSSPASASGVADAPAILAKQQASLASCPPNFSELQLMLI